MKRQTIASEADVAGLEVSIRTAAAYAAQQLTARLGGSDALAVLADIKFTPLGCDPLDTERPLNLIEQVNQTFTYWASCRAARWLLQRHPESAPFTMNLGNTAGHDIESADGLVRAEVFAVTHPASNRKLQKDAKRLPGDGAAVRYIFYLSPKAAAVKEIAGIKIVRLPFPSWLEGTE